MISTITSSTVLDLATFSISGLLALIGILVLMTLLIQKELFSVKATSRLVKTSQIFNIGIVPLLLAFIMIVASRVVEAIK
jgi:hypothetical protein